MKESFNQRQNFLNNLASRLNCAPSQAEVYFDAVIAEFKALLMRGESFTISGFGKFEVRKKPARMGRNPKTGQALPIDAKAVPAFSPGDALKIHVNGALNYQ